MTTTEKPSESLMARIKKLLSKTEASGCTQEEAANALGFATRLMAEHELTMADLVANGAADEASDDVHVDSLKRFELVNQLAYQIVQEFCFVTVWIDSIRSKQTGKKIGTKVHMFGKADQVEVAKDMWRGLHAAFDRLWNYYKIVNNAPHSDRPAFLRGVEVGFSRKMRDHRKVVEAERGPGTGLVLASANAKNLALFHAAYPGTKTKACNYTSTGSADARSAGVEAGKNLNLNKGLGGSGMKGIA
jgi:hypothetical protein